MHSLGPQRLWRLLPWPLSARPPPAPGSRRRQMATLDTAEKLLGEMRDVAYPAAVKDLAELREFAKAQGEAEELQVGWGGVGWGGVGEGTKAWAQNEDVEVQARWPGR
jgi:hypothetical protein